MVSIVLSEWFHMFNNGKFNNEGKQCSGGPKANKDAEMEAFLWKIYFAI